MAESKKDETRLIWVDAYLGHPNMKLWRIKISTNTIISTRMEKGDVLTMKYQPDGQEYHIFDKKDIIKVLLAIGDSELADDISKKK